MQAVCKMTQGYRRNIPAVGCVFVWFATLLRSSKGKCGSTSLSATRTALATNADAVSTPARRPDQLLGGNSIGLFCLPVLNSMIFRETPGKIAEIGLTRSTGLSVVPTTS